MYNLMVTARDNAWEEGAYVWDKSRIFEGTDENIKLRLESFSETSLKELASYRTLFMYERHTDGIIRVGKIKHVQMRGTDIRVIYEFDNTLPNLTLDQIVALKWELGIQDFEFSRTHWAVKDINLFEVLKNAGIQSTSNQIAELPPTIQSGGRVFIVHGRDTGAAEKVARFLQTKVGLNVCILHEQVNLGRTIITKFQQEASDAIFSIVLMTGDDIGALDQQTPILKKRARQNVIFEMGFFLGKLGQDKVCALISDGVEKPSDYDGVVYISFDNQDGWKHKLVNELQAADIPVSQDWWKSEHT